MKILIYYYYPYHSGFYRGTAEALGIFLAESGRSRLKGRVSDDMVELEAEKLASEILNLAWTATVTEKPVSIESSLCAAPYEYGTARGKINSVEILAEVYPLGYEPSGEKVHDIKIDEEKKRYEIIPVRRFDHRGKVVAYLKVPPSKIGTYRALYIEVFMVDDGRIYVPFFRRDFHDSITEADTTSELSIQSALLYVSKKIAQCSRCPGWHIVPPEELPPWVAAWVKSAKAEE